MDSIDELREIRTSAFALTARLESMTRSAKQRMNYANAKMPHAPSWREMVRELDRFIEQIDKYTRGA